MERGSSYIRQREVVEAGGRFATSSTASSPNCMRTCRRHAQVPPGRWASRSSPPATDTQARAERAQIPVASRCRTAARHRAGRRYLGPAAFLGAHRTAGMGALDRQHVLIVVGFAELLRSVFEHYLVETKFLRAILVGRSRVEGLSGWRSSSRWTAPHISSTSPTSRPRGSRSPGGRIYNADGTFAGNFQPLLCHLTNARLDYTYFGLAPTNLAHFGVGYTDFWRRNNYVGMFFRKLIATSGMRSLGAG